MPEGDTIARTASALRRRVGGRTVTAASPAALHRLVGRRLDAVDTVGKHLYLRFGEDIALHTHMRMTGSWHLYRRGESWRRPAHLTTAALEFGDLVAVLFAAPVCELVPAAAAGAGLGPDVLADHFDAAEALRRARDSGHATVAELLLDQRVCAGIGNMHRCEALWQERADPFARPVDLDDEALLRCLRRARSRMRAAVVGDRLAAPVAVHRRAGLGCPRCGERVRARSLGDPPRTLFWCPRCQEAGPDASARGQEEAGDGHPLHGRRRHDQGMEDLVEAERPRPRVGTPAGEHHRAGDVGRPAARQQRDRGDSQSHD